jgi:hypothetical protein
MSETPGIWWYGVNSLFAPRTAARRLLADDRLPAIAWQLVWMGLAALFLASFLVNALADHVFPALMSKSPPMLASGLAGRLIEAVAYAIVTLIAFRIAMYLWSNVLKYNEPPHGVLAATSLTIAVMLLLSPVQEVLYIAAANASSSVETLAFLGNFVFIIALTTVYYSEALRISYGRAFALNLIVVVLAILLLGLLLALASFLIWMVGGSLFSPTVGG